MNDIDGISKILKHDKSQSLMIVSYIELNEIISNDFIKNYTNEIIDYYPILKKKMILHENEYIFEKEDTFQLNDHIEIIENVTDDSIFIDLINKEINIFHLLFYIDHENNKSRIIFCVDHSYCDGYKIIDILTHPIKDKQFELPKFNRKVNLFNKIYYILVGTIILLIMNIKIFIKLMINLFSYHQNNNKNYETDYIICDKLSLSKIKSTSKSMNITVNDFLFSLMIKTDQLYTGLNRELTISFPSHISSNKFNNFIPNCLYIDNHYEINVLIKKVHTLFNYFKYSLFVPISYSIINYCIDLIPIHIISTIYDLYCYKSDYIFSNMICPEINYSVNDVCFLTKHKCNAVTFNIISYGDNINIICSFKKELIKNKEHFKECIYKSYNELLKLDTGFFK